MAENELEDTSTGSSFLGGDSGAGATSPDPISSEAPSTDAPASNEPLPATTTDGVNGASEVAAEAAQKKAEEEAKSGEAAVDAGKAAYDGLKGVSKIKPGYGGLTDLPDVYDKAKAAVTSAQEGDAVGAATSGLDATGGALKSIAPALQKLAPSLLPNVLKALGPIGAGLQVGGAVGKAGDDASTSNDWLQKQIKERGLANSDGSPTSVTDALRNRGDQVGASVGEKYGAGWGNAAGTATKILGAIPAAPVLVGSATAGAGKYIYGQGKKLLGLGDG